jgi:hypothetical protein
MSSLEVGEFFPPVFLASFAVFWGFAKGDGAFSRKLRGFLARIFADSVFDFRCLGMLIAECDEFQG